MISNRFALLLAAVSLTLFAIHLHKKSAYSNKQHFNSDSAKPTNLKLCKEITYPLEWVSTSFDKDFNQGATVDIKTTFVPVLDGHISKFEFGIYFRDVKMTSIVEPLDVDFVKGQTMVLNNVVKLPNTIPPTLAIEVRLKFFSDLKEELECVRFDLKFA